MCGYAWRQQTVSRSAEHPETATRFSVAMEVMIPAWLIGGRHEREAAATSKTGTWMTPPNWPKVEGCATSQRAANLLGWRSRRSSPDTRQLSDWHFTTCEVRPWTIQERPCVCQSPVLPSKMRSSRISSGRTRPACFSATAAFRMSVDVARRSRRWVLEPLLVLLLYHHHWQSCDHQTEWSC